MSIAMVSGGALVSYTRNLDETVVAVKTAEGKLYGLTIANDQAAVTYIQIFNVASGSVTLATTVPVMQIRVPASSHYDVVLPAVGIGFTTAISIAATTAEFGNTGSNDGVVVSALYA